MGYKLIDLGTYAADGNVTVDLLEDASTLATKTGSYDVGRIPTFRAVVKAGEADAVACVVSIYQGSLFGATVVYDDDACATISLSGTAQAAGSVTLDPVASRFWKVAYDLTGTYDQAGEGVALTLELAE